MTDEPHDVINPVKMVDTSKKPVVWRIAEAEGEIQLRAQTVDAIKLNKTKKGDVLTIAEIAGILAAKRTAAVIPLCHYIPLSQINIVFDFSEDCVKCRCTVLAKYSTGVEMEALIGVTVSLLTIWDMVKYLEKNEEGQYPYTRIRTIRVTKKWKEE